MSWRPITQQVSSINLVLPQKPELGCCWRRLDASNTHNPPQEVEVAIPMSLCAHRPTGKQLDTLEVIAGGFLLVCCSFPVAGLHGLRTGVEGLGWGVG